MPPGPTVPSGPPGVSIFSLEGRQAPALYLIGWVGSILGLAIVVTSFASGGALSGGWLFLVGIVILALGLLAATGSQAVERSRRVDLPYRGPSPVLAFATVIVLTVIATVAILAPLAVLGLDPGSPAATAISLLITLAAYVAVVRLFVVGPGALSWSDMGLRSTLPNALRDLGVGALLAVPVLVVTLILGAVMSRFLQPAPGPLPEATDTAGLFANLLTAAVLAPIGEELFFRGFTTTAWARAYGPPQAVIRGAVFFAAAHVLALVDTSFELGLQHALFAFVTLLPVAVVLGWLYLARRSLYAPIGLHSAFNAIQVLLLFSVAGLGP
jgi:CAAX protease family protein